MNANNDPTLLARLAVQKLSPYQSARRLGGKGDVWLNANESPFAFLPDWAQVAKTSLNRYPEPQPKALIDAYATYANVDPDCVLVGRGADEILELVVRAFCDESDGVLYCPPTYGMYAISAQTYGAPTKTVPLRADGGLDLPAIEANLDGVKAIFVCNPNNPTGAPVAREDIVRLLESAQGKAIVVVDEAYIEFCPERSVADLIGRYRHLLVARTLSKAFALAGVRCGFALASPPLIALLQKTLAPYPVAGVVAAIAEQALSAKGVAQMQARAAQIVAWRKDFAQALQKTPRVTKVYPSCANFVLVRIESMQEAFDFLWSQGVIVRNQSHVAALRDCVRFSVGAPSENARALTVLQQWSAQ